MIEEEAIGVQIGVVTESLPHIHFQTFRMADAKMLTVSPFRLGEQPNIRLGVAMITSAPEAIALHEKTVNEMWRRAIKGAAAAAHLRTLLSPPATDAAPESNLKTIISTEPPPAPDDQAQAENLVKRNAPKIRGAPSEHRGRSR